MPVVVDANELARRAKVHVNLVRELTALGILQTRPVPGFPLYDLGNLWTLKIAKSAAAIEARKANFKKIRRLSRVPIEDRYRNDPRMLMVKASRELSETTLGYKMFSDIKFALVTPAYIRALCAYAGVSLRTLFKAIGLKYESGMQMMTTYHPFTRSVSAIRARAAIYWLTRFLIVNRAIPPFFVFLCGINDKAVIRREIKKIQLCSP